MSSCLILKREAMERDEEEQLPKRRKSNGADNSNDHEDLEQSDQTEFTDINTDCLEKIFKCLELGDLLNIADTSKHFKETADIVVSRKFAKKTILINNIRVSRTRLINVRNNFVELIDLKSIFQTLRNFGHLIKKLRVYGDGFENLTEQTVDFRAKSIGYLSYYIGDYCASSLTELTIKKVISFNLLKKPFLNVEKVKINTIYSPRVQLKRNWFIKMFPNVRQLKYDSVFGRITNFECITDHFPKMEHLDISYAFSNCKNLYRIISITDDECIANNANVMKTLSLNPQLTSLALPYISDIEILQKISEQQHQLEYLSFQYAPKKDTNSNIVHFKSVKKLKIRLCSPSQRPNSEAIEVGTVGNEMVKIPFSFEKIEVLTIQTCFQFSDEFFNFIGKHQSITKLSLRSCGWPRFLLDNLNRTKIFAALPMLKEIHLFCYSLEVEDAIAFSMEFKQLEIFSFKFDVWHDYENRYKNLVKRLRNKWQCTLCSHGSFVTMKRTIPN